MSLRLHVNVNVDIDFIVDVDVDFIIESFPQLTLLGIEDLGLTGEHLRRTNPTAYPADTFA